MVRVVRGIHELRRSIIIVIIVIITIIIINSRYTRRLHRCHHWGARSIFMCSDAVLRSMVTRKRALVGSCAGQGSFLDKGGSPRLNTILALERWSILARASNTLGVTCMG